MTFLELQEELGRRIVELKGAESFWDPTERKFALNRAQREIAKELQLTRDLATVSTVIGQQDYSLGASGFNIAASFMGLIPVLRTQGGDRSALILYDGVQDEPLVPRSLEWLYANVSSWRTDANGRPKYFFAPEGGQILKDALGLYPKPDTVWANGLRLHYLYWPADMTADGHVPFNKTAGTTDIFRTLEPYHHALVWNALWLLLQDDDVRLAERARLNYFVDLAAAKKETYFPEVREPRFPEIAPTYRGGGW